MCENASRKKDSTAISHARNMRKVRKRAMKDIVTWLSLNWYSISSPLPRFMAAIPTYDEQTKQNRQNTTAHARVRKSGKRPVLKKSD